jgi:hypothetical protein
LSLFYNNRVNGVISDIAESKKQVRKGRGSEACRHAPFPGNVEIEISGYPSQSGFT